MVLFQRVDNIFKVFPFDNLKLDSISWEKSVDKEVMVTMESTHDYYITSIVPISQPRRCS